MSDPVYEYDETGTNPANLIVREPHVLTEINSLSKRTIVPVSAPFHLNNFLFEYRDPNGNYSPLVPGVDFDYSLIYMGASVALGKKIYGGLTVHRELLEGMVFVTYQCLGGIWGGDKAVILENLANLVYNPRIATWDQILNIPEVFPPKPHSQELLEFRGLEDLIAVMDTLINQLGVPPDPTLYYTQSVLELRTDVEVLQRKVESMQQEIDRLTNPT